MPPFPPHAGCMGAVVPARVRLISCELVRCCRGKKLSALVDVPFVPFPLARLIRTVALTLLTQLAGGVGLLASTLPPVSDALPWLQSASALGLFALAVAVTPANIFMATHNAPGPGPKAGRDRGYACVKPTSWEIMGLAGWGVYEYGRSCGYSWHAAGS